MDLASIVVIILVKKYGNMKLPTMLKNQHVVDIVPRTQQQERLLMLITSHQCCCIKRERNNSTTVVDDRSTYWKTKWNLKQ